MPATTTTCLDLDTRTAEPDEDDPVASDGLTLDTPLGAVDLVAVRRKLSGFEVELTPAELAWIMRRQRAGARRQAAYALGTGYIGLLRALERTRHTAPAPTTGTLASPSTP